MERNQLTSIIIVTHNQLPYTMKCLNSILKYTKEAYEIILVDNHSTDETVNIAKKIHNVAIIENNSNIGFPAACNKGLLYAQGENIVLLNNDTVVTNGWLSRLLWHLNKSDSIGIVGPRSNYIISTQIITPIPYKSLKEMHLFSQKQAKKHHRKFDDVHLLSGMCMVFKKSLVEQIGGFDELFSPGYYEDTDFCIRAQIYGKILHVANDVFIHHYGSASFQMNKREQLITVRSSKEKFYSKWGLASLEQIIEIAEKEKPFNQAKHYIPLIKDRF